MSALPDSLGKVRKEAVDALKSRFNAMCAGADDTLFDLSQKAPAEEQSLYFDAMRELRLQRQAIADSFLAAIDRDFDALTAASGAAGQKPAAQAYTLDTLTLLGDEELDVSVAFQGMVKRASDALGTDLDHLRQRFAKALARDVESEQLPLHPEKICEHFRIATDALKVPVKAKLILYKLFERKVLDELHDVIAAGNLSLSTAGVLPEIKSAKPRAVPSPDSGRGRGRGGAAGKGKKSAHDDDDEDDDADDDGAHGGRGRGGDMSGAFAELLALARGAMMPGGMPGAPMQGGFMPGGFAGGAPGGGMQGGFAGGVPGVVPAGMMMPVGQLQMGQIPVMYNGQAMVGGMIVQSDVPLQVVNPAELTALLTRLQQLQPAVAPAEPGRLIEHVEAVDVKIGLSELMHDVAEAPRALNGADDDVINLVSMLFDFILDDAELPLEIKALVGRLQIPLLKVSLLDKSFFSAEDHAARRLVNSLAHAGIGWTREADDGLYRKIENVVFTVLNEFTDDVTLFERLAVDFDAFVAEREKRMSLIEARLRDREEGQAKADVAQKLVRDVIATRLAGRALPSEALAIVQDAWQRVLYMTAIRDGADSEVWQQRIKVLEVLVWCAQRYEKPELRERQRGLVPRLVISLRKGFEAIGFDASRGEEMLSALNAQLQQLVGGERPRTVRIVAEAQSRSDAQAAKDARPVGSAASDAVQVLRRSEDEVVIAASPEPAPASTQVMDERWRETAENLPPGTWIEFSEQDFKVRGKIAARIRAQGKYVFVNGRGVKIFEKTIEQLTVDLQSGVARMVSETALFDRALENMISRLKTGQAVSG